jgi:hypothetical protein
MNNLKNIRVTINPISVNAGYEESAEFKTQEVVVDINEMVSIIGERLKSNEELSSFLCQVSEDQHLSEERIQYFFGEDNRFLLVSNMTIREQGIYEEFKSIVSSNII